MNEFILYEQLCTLEHIAEQYAEGKKQCGLIRRTAEQIASRTYRVAVIGEFKRGKSSLINALVGAEVLPTDILPMTATVTRMIYGTNRQIVIRYRDGRSEERTMEELFDFATKYDKKRERTALSVQEIEVSYPSVLCRNHIEILDTPGLNDNESMSAVTLSVIGDVDAAIVVTSVKEPLSISEQELILSLIEQHGIRHIVFVATFLDTFEREAEKDRILAFIRERLAADLSQRAEKHFQDQPALLSKARAILEDPDLFGVSSRQAMAGFTNNDEDLLEESRFPKFKEELLALLTAAQSTDLPPKTAAMADLVARQLPVWKQAEDAAVQQRESELLLLQENRKRYADSSRGELMRLFQEMDETISRQRKDGMRPQDLEQLAIRSFVKELGALNAATIQDTVIRNALHSGAQTFVHMLKPIEQTLQQWIEAAMDSVTDTFKVRRWEAGLEDGGFEQEILKQKRERSFPTFIWTTSPIPQGSDLVGMDVMRTVRPAVQRSLEDYGQAINRYIGRWRVVLMRQNDEDREAIGQADGQAEELQSLKLRSSALQFNYEQHTRQVEDIQALLRKALIEDV